MTRQHLDIDFHGLRLRCYPDSHSASRAIYFSTVPDYREMRFMLDYLRPGDRFIDVGANVGLYTLLALSVVGRTGYVDAFEPSDSVAARLGESLTINAVENVTVRRLAVSDSAAQAVFVLTDDDCTAHIDVNPSSPASKTQVRTARLDECLADVPYAMAKFDIEGYEPFGLRGASKWLAHGNPPVLQIEMAGYSHKYGISTPELIGELEQQGYFTAVYSPQERTLEVTDRPWEIPVDNVLAIHRTRETFVQNRIATSER
jgi:FkbM family methyltransferase